MAIEKNYDEKGNASHYDTERINSIVLFEKVYGTLAVMYFCEINAMKYRLRMGRKPGQDLEQELLKAKWYEDAAAFYFRRLKNGSDIVFGSSKREGLPWDDKNKNR